MPRSLAEAQAAIAAAVSDGGAPMPAGALADPSRMAVHQANAIAGLIDTLGTRFPVTRQLVGEDFFRAMARAFVGAHPPRSPVLLAYGDALPAFIDGFGPAGAVPYLADVAQLEAAWSQAYHAAEAAPIDPAALGALTPDRLAAARLGLHPSVRVVRSSHPIASIWAAHQGDPVAAVERWEAEDVVVCRPDAEVVLYRLPPGAAAFALALRAGRTIEAASEAALADSAGFDPGRGLVALVAAGALIQVFAPTDSTADPQP